MYWPTVRSSQCLLLSQVLRQILDEYLEILQSPYLGRHHRASRLHVLAWLHLHTPKFVLRKGKRIKPPKEEPEGKDQTNLTDADSRLMRKNKHSEYQQCYNAQAVVDAEGSQLVLGTRVSQCASDRNELVADIDAIPHQLGTPSQVLADNGYANGDEVEIVEERHIDVLVSVGREDRRRPHGFRPAIDTAPAKEPKMPWLQRMKKNGVG